MGGGGVCVSGADVERGSWEGDVRSGGHFDRVF